MPEQSAILSRAQGSFLGQLAGDALGSLVEFQTPETIARAYPDGVRHLATSPVWGTLPGQPTDDSEMAILLARSLIAEDGYNAAKVKEQYLYWIHSGPFDVGSTIATGLLDRPNPKSQANGALMRISPLGIFCAGRPERFDPRWPALDAALTHPHPVCQQVNTLYVDMIATAIRDGVDSDELYGRVLERAVADRVEPSILERIEAAHETPPPDFMNQQGWVLTAFHNAIYQLLHAPTFEEGVVDTVCRGGDTDTNAAICGALLGAVYGRDHIPERWERVILECRPKKGDPNVRHPRPQVLWPTQALDLVEGLLG